MRATRVANHLTRLLPLLAFPVRASAQSTAADSSSTISASTSCGGSVAILAMVLLLLLSIGIVVKVFDHKRKREDEALSLQSQISDALLLDRSLAGLPIAAVADCSLWGRSPVVVAITGTVPTPEQREAVMRLVAEQLSRRHVFARAEDRLVVDPLMQKQIARGL
jgi:hypothetical protein